MIAGGEGLAAVHLPLRAHLAVVYIDTDVELESDHQACLVSQGWYVQWYSKALWFVLRTPSDYQRYKGEAIHLIPLLGGEPTIQCGSPEMVKQMFDDIKSFPKPEKALVLKYVVSTSAPSDL